MMAACGVDSAGEGPPVLELADDTIRLRGGVSLHVVTLRGRGATGEIEPPRIEASAGDVLRFVASDAHGYSVRFLADRMPPEAAAFLDSTHQLASPPLLGVGAAWVLSLEGAPPGEYPFVSANHNVQGLLIVR